MTKPRASRREVNPRPSTAIRLALLTLGQGFLREDGSLALRDSIRQGRLTPDDFYQQLVGLVFRLRCLGLAEKRGLVTSGPWLLSSWPALVRVFGLARDVGLSAPTGPARLDGGVFDPAVCPDLEAADCGDEALRTAFDLIAEVTPGRESEETGEAPVETLGTTYEGLVGLRARIDLDGDPPFEVTEGTDRKRHGAYYTPAFLTRVLIEQTLGPVVQERAGEDQILNLQVCDPAAGTGHVLLAAARFLGRELAKVRTGGGEPPAEAERRARREVIRCSLYGVDQDPLAVRICQTLLWIEAGDPSWPLSLSGERIKVGNGLVGEPDLAPLPPFLTREGGLGPPFHWPREFPEVFAGGGFDVVIGNPPFGNAIEAETARSNAETHYFAAAYPGIARGAYDRSVLFFGRALTILRDRGTLGLICPRATASGRGAAGLRGRLAREAPPRLLWFPGHARLFGAASVFVGLVVARKGFPPATLLVSTDADPEALAFRSVPSSFDGRSTWWIHLAPRVEPDGFELSGMAPLGGLVEIWAGCAVAVAYDLSPQVRDDPEGPGLKLVTTGGIDRFKLRWGEELTRFLKRDYRFPRWPEDSDGAIGRARERQRRPKILVGGLSRIIEAVLDPDGKLGGVVAAHVVVPRLESADALERLLVVLNSAMFSYLFMRHYGAKQLSGGNCTVGKAELLSTPVPEDTLGGPPERAGLWVQAIDLARQLEAGAEGESWRQIDARLHAVVSALYGLSRTQHESVYGWWLGRG